MDPSLAERTVIVSTVHRPRTLQRVVTTVAGRGFEIEALRYVQSSSERALITVVVRAHLASRSVDRLCQAIARATDVIWARTLSPDSGVDAGLGRLRLAHFGVSTRAGGTPEARAEAVIAAVVDGSRRLSAGEGEDAVEALVDAFTALVERLVPAHALSLHVTDRWSSVLAKGHAFAAVRIESRGRCWERVCGAQDEMSAVAAGLATVADDAVAALVGAVAREGGEQVPTPG